MKKILIGAGLVLACWSPTFAQTIVKTDVMPYFDKTLPPATTVQEAYQRGKCASGKCDFEVYYQSSNNAIAQIIKQIAQQTTQQEAQNQQYQALAGKIDEKEMASMTQAQKTAYVQQKMNQTYGDNRPTGMASDGTMELAKQMQDPEFQKKFRSMTPEQQAALVMNMNQGGQATASPKGKKGTKEDPRMQAVMADLQNKMMNDPKFRQEFMRKSEAEQEAYFREQARKNGITDAEMTATKSQSQAVDQKNAALELLVDAQNKGQKITDAQLKPFMDYNASNGKNGSMFKPTYIDSLDIRHSAIDNWKAKELRKLPTHMVEYGEAGREREYVNPAAARAVENKAMEKHMQQVDADLKYLAKHWQKTKGEYKQLVGPFNTALAKAGYGEGYTDPNQMELLRNLAGMQSNMFQYPLSLNGMSQQIDAYAAHWLKNQKEYESKKSEMPHPFWE
jgi:hypothetical protein